MISWSMAHNLIQNVGDSATIRNLTKSGALENNTKEGFFDHIYKI